VGGTDPGGRGVTTEVAGMSTRADALRWMELRTPEPAADCPVR
jgi:hypothetical protein